MKKKPFTEYVLLGTLMSGPKHGYEIRQFLGTALGLTWHVGTSQLYNLLKRLEREDLVGSSLETQKDRPSKRVFSLSEAGAKAFLVWLRCSTDNVRDLRVEFLAKLFFFQRLGLEGGGDLINRQVKEMNKTKERLQQKYENGEDPYDRLVLDFKMSTIDAWLDWIDTKAKTFVEKEVSVREQDNNMSLT